MTPTSAASDTAGNVGTEVNVGIVPHIVRAWSVSLVGAGGVTGDIKLQKIGMESGAVAVDVATITLIAADVQGDVIYKRNLDVEVHAGEFLFLNIPANIGSGPTFKSSVLLEPRWENPENLGTRFRETA